VVTDAAPGAVEVVRAGALTTVQDLGRPGYAHLGVGRSGALDLRTHTLLNRLVGNPAAAATLETTVTGVALRPSIGVFAAVGGAAARVTLDGRPAAWGEAVWVAAGAVLDIGPAQCGVRSYVAFAGGVAAPSVLGSRSTDLLSGLGPPPLHEGDVLALGRPADPAVGADTVPWSTPEPVIELPVLPGPRADHLTPGARSLMFEAGYTVGAASNRIALRLEGPPLARVGADTVPSEGAVIGAIQVPADGRPIVFLADHPTTGGYPVVGVVVAEGLGRAAQAAPGAVVRFRRAAW
jgi:biotin-dependent carboxylase-like uncharacterized protein